TFHIFRFREGEAAQAYRAQEVAETVALHQRVGRVRCKAQAVEQRVAFILLKEREDRATDRGWCERNAAANGNHVERETARHEGVRDIDYFVTVQHGERHR